MSPIIELIGGTKAYGWGAVPTATPAPASFESVATVTLASTATSIEFTSIPSTYSHLQIRYIARTTRAQYTQDVMAIQFNSNSSAIYNHHNFDGTGSVSESGGNSGSGNWARIARPAATSAPVSVFSPGVIDILDYANTNKNKIVRNFCGVDVRGDLGAAGAGVVSTFSGLFNSTAAISSIKLFIIVSESQFSFVTNSTFALYGIKGPS